MPAGTEATTAGEVVERLAAHGLTVAVCESLTAGLLSGRIAQVPGASAVLRGGLVTYATDLKARLAGVDPVLLAERGAVDPEVAVQMAQGAARVCEADLGVACTGVAGPTPQDGQPVGRVFIAMSGPDGAERCERLDLRGERQEIREATVGACLRLLLASVPPAG